MRLGMVALSVCVGGLLACSGDDGGGIDAAVVCDEPLVVTTAGALVEGEGALLADVTSVLDADELASSPRLVAIEGCDLSTGVELRPMGGEFEQIGSAVTNGRLAIVTVRVPIDLTRDDGLAVVAVDVVDGENVLGSTAVQVEFLPELDSLDNMDMGGRFSFVDIKNAPAQIGIMPVRFHSTSTVLLSASTLDASASGQAPGPAGGRGGDPGQDGGGAGGGGGTSGVSACSGGGGGNGSPGVTGTPPGGIGGPVVNDDTLLASLVLEGGGGGGGCIAGQETAIGGGGGGVIDILVGGVLAVTTADSETVIDVGGGSGSGSGSALGGAGAGGTLLLRAAGLRGSIRYITEAVSGDGSLEGAGRVRHDIDGLRPCGQPGPTVCADVAGQAIKNPYTGARVVRPSPAVVNAESADITITLGDAMDVELEVDGTFDSTFTGDSHTITGAGVHRLCVINKAVDGTVALSNAAWRRRAEDCVELGLVPPTL